MIEIAVCDDDMRILTELERRIKQQIPDCRVRRFSSGEQLLKARPQADLIFLDIEMEGMDGMAVAKQLKDSALLIFVTAHEDRVFDAFDVGAFHYLLKPLEEEKFRKVLKRAQEEIRKKKRKKPLRIKEKGEYRMVRPEEIYYVESNGRKLLLHTVQGTTECYGRMQELEQELGEDFYRCHRGYLVHLKYVDSYDSSNIQLKDGSMVYLARQKYGEFVRTYLNYLRRMGDM